MTTYRTVIITGANTGLGFECAKAVAKANKGWHIILACRNLVHGEDAKRKITKSTGYDAISVMELDLADQKSIRNFVERFCMSEYPPLKGLINNAGVQILNGLVRSTDGYELTFATNHLGHFLLTNLLLKNFHEPGRIMVVSSGTHDPDTKEGRNNKPVFLGAAKLAKPESEKEMSGMQRYTTSKLANVLFSYELVKRLEGRNITVNIFDPTAVPDTNLTNSLKNPIVKWIMRSPWLLSLLGYKTSTPEISGAAMARLLLDEGLENVTAKYFQIYDEKKSSKQSYDLKLAEELWDDSMKLVRL